MEGKDKPKEKPINPTNEHGKTCGLLLCMLKNIYGRGMVVILDSGFCVLKGLVELRSEEGCFCFGSDQEASILAEVRSWVRS